MSDLVLTIESDGEGPATFSDNEGRPAATSRQKQKKTSKKREKLAMQVDSKGKKRAADQDDAGMDAGFQFDAFGGGELHSLDRSSKKYARTDAWVSRTLVSCIGKVLTIPL